MPDEAFQWMGRIKSVEREYGAVRFGIDRLLADLDPKGPEVLKRIEKGRYRTSLAQ